jgi:hypothetical protein
LNLYYGIDIAIYKEILEKEINMKERVSKISNTILEATIWFSLAIPIFIAILD